MKKVPVSREDFKKIHIFMKKKKISFAVLSAEMLYDKNHVMAVFRGEKSVTAKFIGHLLKAFDVLLRRDLAQFRKLTQGFSWITFSAP